MGGIDAQSIGEVLLDRAVLRLHLVESGIEVLLLDARDGRRNLLVSAGFDKGVDGLLVLGDDVVVAPQVANPFVRSYRLTAAALRRTPAAP